MKIQSDTKHLILLVLILLSIPFMIYFSGQLKESLNLPTYYNHIFEEAIVTNVQSETITPDPVISGLMVGKQDLSVKILHGKYQNSIYETTNVISQAHNIVAKEGMTLVVGIRETDDGPNVWVYNHKRSHLIYALVALFIGLLLLLGGKKGFHSIVALLFTGTVFIFVLLPLIFTGFHPIYTSIVLTSITTIISFLLISGFNKKTLSAIIGTLLGICLAGILSYIFSHLAHVTGIHLEKGEQLVYVASDYQIKIRGLMFATILIASLGAIMDVAMSIASSVYEIHKIKPDMNAKDLAISGINIGRDIMGTMANTLILAFLGGSLSSMLVIWGYQMSYTQLINMPFITIEIIQGICGSIGIILAVPMTAVVAACFSKKVKFSNYSK